MRKRVLSMVMAFILVISLLPTASLAANSTKTYCWNVATITPKTAPSTGYTLAAASGEVNKAANVTVSVSNSNAEDAVWTKISASSYTWGTETYSKRYIKIQPSDGYYVQYIVVACNDNGSYGPFQDPYGDGLNCQSVGRGSAYMDRFDPTNGDIILDTKVNGFFHGGRGAPYHILIQLAKMPNPVYVIYDAGEAGALFSSESTIVSSADAYATSGGNVSFQFATEDQSHSVLAPAKTQVSDSSYTYTFTGWKLEYYSTVDATGSFPAFSGKLDHGDQTVANGSVIKLSTYVRLTAQWTKEEIPTPPPVTTYTLTYDANGGVSESVPAQVTGLENGATPGLTTSPAPTHADTSDNLKVTFIGWTAEATTQIFEQDDVKPSTINSVTIDGENVTVYAAWGLDADSDDVPDVLENRFTLIYDANGGTGAPEAECVLTQESSHIFTVSSTEPARTDYEFLGWADQDDANEADYQSMDEITLTLATDSARSAEKTIYAVWAEQDTPTPPATEWDHSKSKSATNLIKQSDGTYTSEVTLALPSAEEELATDVVFVLDKSTSQELEEQALGMLDNLKEHIQSTNAKIKVGVVIFNKEAHVTGFMDLSTQYDAIAEAIQAEVQSGTNTHAGLLAAKKMLDEDAAVDASRKYLIFVSDGITYIYGAEPTSTAWEFYADAPKHFAGPDNWATKYGSNAAPVDWDAWLRETGAQVKDDGTTYDYPYQGTFPETYIPYTENENHAMSVDKALYLTNQVYQFAVQDGYHCYAMAANPSKGQDYAWGPSFMEFLANGQSVDFSCIEEEILYLVGPGSRVIDEIGSGTGSDAYNFDFILGADQLRLTVGEVSYTASESTQMLDEGETARYVFTAEGVSAENQAEAPFVLHYYKDGITIADDKEYAECFIWDINVSITNFARVQLTYCVKLTNPRTASGTYGIYDGNGDGIANDGTTAVTADRALYTNNSAVLYPVSSGGEEGQPEEFPKPSVSYTISGGSSSGGSTVLNTDDHFSYIIGYDNGSLRPEANITRGETATIFFRLLKNDIRSQYWSQTNSYSDVTEEMWYNNAISTLSNMGIINGCADGTFRPDESISRAEFAKIAVSFFDYTVVAYEGYFPDVAEEAWYAAYVEAARQMHLIEGYLDGTFQPENPITRAEACAIVNRTLGRIPVKDRLLSRQNMVIWPDCDADSWYYADMMEATNSHDYRWVSSNGEKVEQWTSKLSQRDWAALEREWSDAHSAPGGEVMD